MENVQIGAVKNEEAKEEGGIEVEKKADEPATGIVAADEKQNDDLAK